MVEKRNNTEAVGEELVITRIFDASPERVWKVWTDPELAKHWWGPKDYTAPFAKSDFRVGGKYLYCMRSPEGKDYWGTGVYKEIIPLKKIVATDSFADENGNVVPASHYGMTGEWPLELLVTITFEEQEGKTKLTLKHTGFATKEDSKMTQGGWQESLDKFADFLTKK